MVVVRRRIAKLALTGLVVCLAVLVAVGAAAFWRLSQGPVSLSFLRDNVQTTISRGLGGMPVEVGDVILERDASEGRISVRLRDLRLFDESGVPIAEAPRAAIELDGSALIAGRIVPVGLELIGPNMKVRRLAGGEVKLGFGDTARVPFATGVATGGEKVKDDAVQTAATVSGTSDGDALSVGDGAGLIDYIKTEFLAKSGEGATATIRAISISQADVSLYDEENRTIWHAPKVNLSFGKVDGGVTLFVDAWIDGANEPWHVVTTANVNGETGDYSLTAKFHDLVPADISRRIFMLSDLTRVRLPLSGRLEMELSGTGALKSANAEISAAAGQIDFPDFLSRPLKVDEGLLRLKWDPQSKSLDIRDSLMLVGGAQAAVAGRITPRRNGEGRMDTVLFEVKSRNAVSREQGTDADAKGRIDRIEVSGAVSLERGRVDLHDLLIMSGPSSVVRLNGAFAEGEEAISIALSGNVSQVPVEMLRTLWPPIVASQTRAWVNENVFAGRLTDGSFTIDLPDGLLAAALRENRPLPDESVRVDVDFADATSNYFEGQPPLENLKGKIKIDGDRMALIGLDGLVRAGRNETVEVTDGRMDLTELAAPVTRGEVNVKLAGSLDAFLDLADRKPLSFISGSGFDPSGASADVAMDLRVRLPLVDDRPEGSTEVDAEADITGLRVEDAARGLPLTEGRLRMKIDNKGVEGRGPIKLGGIPAQLAWAKRVGPNGVQRIGLETTLSEVQRRNLGFDLSSFLSGPIAFKIEGQSRDADVRKVRVRADLSKTDIRVDAINWLHSDPAKTGAVFEADFSDPKAVRITDLKLKGRNLDIKGAVTLGVDGTLVSAELPTVNLGPNNRMALKASKGGNGVTVLEVSGKTLDARPMISALFAGTASSIIPRPPGEDDRVDIHARFDSVYAYDNQHLSDVISIASAKGQTLTSMRLAGAFADDATLELDIVPRNDGSRNMSVRSTNAGAAFRASNLYSKIQGGRLDFTAHLGKPGEGTIRRGDLLVRKFLVADERRLEQFRRDPNANRRDEPLAFDKLTVPFAVDREFVRIGDARIQGAAVGALAKGSIRKSDGKLSIGGTLIPVYGLNSALSNFPIIGLLLAGGKDEGVFGMTFGLRGTMSSPKIKINPVSALAPGFLRKVFEFRGRRALGQKENHRARVGGEGNETR